MRDHRSVRADLAASIVFLSGLAVAAALFSHEPGARSAAGESTTNLLGSPGSWLASQMVLALGVSVYIVLAAWFVLVILLFLRRQICPWLARLAGWLLLIPAVAVIADRVGTPDADGGQLGTFLARSLDTLAPTPRWLILVSGVFLGVILACDFLLIAGSRAFRWLAGGLLRITIALFRNILRRLTAPARKGVPPFARKPGIPAVRQQEKAPAAGPNQPREAGSIPIHFAGGPLDGSDVPAPASSGDYQLPPAHLLEDPDPGAPQEHEDVLRDRAALLEKTFNDFGLKVRIVGIHTGPVITQYEATLETGLRVNKVTALADDLALNLKVPSVRIIAPIPGRNTVGIEVPNEHRAKVRLKEVMRAAARPPGGRAWVHKLPLFIGKDTEGKPLVYDLAEMPHLLIAGRTGTGKSVCMNSLILSLLMTRTPDEVRMIMIDPKMLELIEYSKIPHLMHPVVKDMKKAEAILAWAVDKMEERYEILSRARVRNIAAYNELAYSEILRRVQPADDEERQRVPEKMPYIVIFIDEMADLILQLKKEVEGHIIRLAQKSRAAGIHLVVATQKPTVDVVTSLIKSNLPARICFQVSSRTDSRVVLDEMGADKLLGKGDMLFLIPGTSTIVRAQGTFASDAEIQNVVEHLECEPNYAPELVCLNPAGKDGKNLIDTLRSRDELYEQAIEVVLREGRGSTSLLQLALGIGYGRAARLIRFMEEDGIVGGYNGSQARDVLYTPDQWADFKKSRMAQSA